MNFEKNWNQKPQNGFEFIYRYYDSNGKSYIGHTKQSLCSRAGGKSGSNYTSTPSKFEAAINKLGFDAFEVEILEEVPADKADDKEKYYIKKFNSMRNGYNSTYGGRIRYEKRLKVYCVVELQEYNLEQLDNLFHNICVLTCRQKDDENSSIDNILKSLEKTFMSIDYNYYAAECEYENISCHPVALIFNFIEIMVLKKYESVSEIYDEMSLHETLGGDMLTVGDYNALRIVLLNNETVDFDFG